MEKINAEVFMAITRLGSYSKAADELGYTKAGDTFPRSSQYRRPYGKGCRSKGLSA